MTGELKIREIKSKVLQTLVLGLVIVGISGKAFASQVSGTVSKVGDATHLEFQGLQDWPYELNRVGKNKILLTLPAFDEKTQATLQTWSDQYIESMTVQKTGSDGRYQLEITLDDSQIESFDYLTDEPSRLIVDIFRGEANPDQKKLKTVKKKKAAKPQGKRLKLADKKSSDSGKRNPAGELDAMPSNSFANRRRRTDFPKTGIFDGGDPNYERFQIGDLNIEKDAIIRSRENIYIRFPMLKMTSSELSELLAARPEYVIRPQPNSENKEARLLIQLFKKKRYGLFSKAFRYFREQYPESIYNEIIGHLAAETYLDRYLAEKDPKLFQKATDLYTRLLENYPNSPLAERTEFILGYTQLERGDSLSAIQRFDRILKNYPDSDSKDQALRAQAAAYLIINKYDLALESLRKLKENAKYPVFGKEADYRIGDVHFMKRDFDKAIAAYKSAIVESPQYESRFPNAHFNMGEANFWKGEYRDALKHYVEFVKRFPSHPFGGYALTRIGENLEILGADQAKVIGAFLESYFRFRNNPGAKVARVRMLSQQMKSMTPKELNKALEQIEEIAENTELPRIKEFVALMVADGYHKREDYKKAMDMMISYYQKNPTSSDLSFFKKRILSEIAKVMKKRVNSDDFLGALKFHKEYEDTWLRNSPRLDIPYFKGVAYEQAGVYDAARTIYEQTLNEINEIQGTPQYDQVRVNEDLPEKGEIHLRLAKVDLETRLYQDASEQLSKINNPEQLSAESQIERVRLGAAISKARGQTQEAKDFLVQLRENWKGKKQLLVPALLDLAQLRKQDREFVDAIDNIEKIESLQDEGVKLKPAVHAKVLETKGEILEGQDKKLAAVETYLNLLNQFEKDMALGSVRYRAGRLLYEKGDLGGAEKIWSQLDEKQDSMFVSLANERLKDAQWQQTYKKYLDRIPAMDNKKKE